MIVPMKKAVLFALKQDREALLLSLQRSGEFMIIPVEESTQLSQKDQAEMNALKAENTLGFATRYQGKRSFLAPNPEIPYEKFIQTNEDATELARQLEQLEEQISAAGTEIGSLEAQRDQLAPWVTLEIPLHKLGATRSVRFHTGYIGLGNADAVKDSLQQAGAEVEILGTGAEGRLLFLACHYSDEEAVMEAAKAAGFAESTPPRFEGLAADAYALCEHKLEEAQALQKDLIQQVADLADRREELEILCDQLKAQCERLSAPATETEATFCLHGWVRSDRMDKVKKAVEQVTEAYDLAFSDPTEEDDPPTVTKNNRFVTQFETITDMFSRPKPSEGLDPNPVMAPWYWIIFGLMMGDAGYGLIMAILLYVFLKVKKPKGEFGKLVRVMWYSSITTMIWGVVFGSYFGETWHPLLFAPLDNPVGMLVFCLILGVLHIFSGMILKMYHDIKNGHFWDAIFDQLSWIILITGLGFLFLPQLAKAGQVMAAIGALTILFTAGRNKKGFGKITGGLGGLYNITGYMSDILSYSRILALSLATGVIGMVMNLLAGMIQGSVIGFVLSLAIYFVGHAFNIVMGLLSAYVHDSRLQYIEFFGKCYEGGGKPFKPLSVATKHVDVIDQNNEI